MDYAVILSLHNGFLLLYSARVLLFRTVTLFLYSLCLADPLTASACNVFHCIFLSCLGSLTSPMSQHVKFLTQPFLYFYRGG